MSAQYKKKTKKSTNRQGGEKKMPPKLTWSPQPDITPYELAQCMIIFFNKWSLEDSAKHIARFGLGRHFHINIEYAEWLQNEIKKHASPIIGVPEPKIEGGAGQQEQGGGCPPAVMEGDQGGVSGGDSGGTPGPAEVIGETEGVLAEQTDPTVG